MITFRRNNNSMCRELITLNAMTSRGNICIDCIVVYGKGTLNRSKVLVGHGVIIKETVQVNEDMKRVNHDLKYLCIPKCVILNRARRSTVL